MTIPSPSDPPAPNGPDRRLPSLDGLRALVILVLLFHFQRIGDPRGPLEAGYRMLLHVGGMTGLEMFFALSGYLITGILLDSRLAPNYFRAFYARRFLRIFPVYYGFLALWLVVLPALLPRLHGLFAPAVANQVYYWTYTMNLQVVLPAGFNGGRGLAHFWSLMVEEQFYLFWPLVVRGLSRARLRATLLVTALASPLLRLALWYLRPDVPEAGYTFTPSHCEALALGALIALQAREPSGLMPWRPWSRAAVLVTLPACVAIYLLTGNFRSHYFWPQTLGIALAAILGAAVVVAALTAGPAALGSRLLALPAVATFGQRSYALYVFHNPIGMLLDALGVGRIGWFATWIPSRLGAQLAYSFSRLVATFAVATITWYLVEKPLMGLRRHFPYGFGRAAAPVARAADSAGSVG